MIQTSIKNNPSDWRKEWLEHLSPEERINFLEHQEKEELLVSITRAIEWEINKLKHYFYAKANIKQYGIPVLEIYIRHTDAKIMAVIELTEDLSELRISIGNIYRQIPLSDPNSLDMKSILDGFYDEFGPKGTYLASLLEKALKLPIK